MKKRIFRSTLLAAIVSLVSGFVIIMSCLYNYFATLQEEQLKDELRIAKVGVEKSGIDYLEQLDYRLNRITWISENGKVIFDSTVSEDNMENHADRKEVIDAFQSGTGTGYRYSRTLGEKTVYYAERLNDGTVLRMSVSRATAGRLLFGMLQPIIVILLIAILLSALLSNKVAKRITEPMNTLDLDHPLENDTYEELAPLLERINKQHGEIDETVLELKKRKNEFSQIVGNMKEGLIVLNDKECILSINPAAKHIFNTDSKCIGKEFLTIERRCEVHHALTEAYQKGHGEVRSKYGDVEYQLDFSRIESDGETIGAVLLVFDVTEQARAERNRREFTANVSHELKTPLQSIMGSAELIENGFVKKEDMPKFIGNIRTEADRLVKLIDDIIHLSQMDDENGLPMEEVDLYSVAEEAVDAVREAAAMKNIQIQYTGEHLWINGVSRLLYELVYNLCDNAVKYNRKNGNVNVKLYRENNQAILTVADTGIGIPKEHIPRIFERFYRVDKSHSKESGGTGLGLSIVKHAAFQHHAKIQIESEENHGTVIKVQFPELLDHRETE